MAKYKLLVHSIKQLVQVVNDKKTVLKGDDMKNIAILEDKNEGYSVVVNRDGKIEAIGRDSDVIINYKREEFQQIIDASGKTVIPGLVDAHTHAVWSGDRVKEFAMKLAGASYMDIHAAGGGIHYTVDCVRNSTEDKLYAQFTDYTHKFLAAGTTLMECKSGYGLDTENELKMLKVLERARNDVTVPMEISATYCGAHSVPKGSTAEDATDDILTNQIPHIQQLLTSGELHVDNIDVFCEKGVYDVGQTRRILEAGKAMGLAVNFHGEELNLLHSAEMGAKIGACAISHLEEVCPEGITAMAEAGTIAVILPTTAYILRLKRPPVRDMIQKGVAVALGSDFNPNAHCYAMPMVMHLSCVLLHMTMEEALVAATINSAASLRKSSTHGSLEVGKVADMLVIDAPRWEHLIYQFGGHGDIITHVIKHGEIVHEKK